MAYVIDPNKDTSLSSLDFMNISFEIIMGYYHDSRINFFKTTNDLDCKIFDDDIYNQWKINDSISNTNQTAHWSRSEATRSPRDAKSEQSVPSPVCNTPAAP